MSSEANDGGRRRGVKPRDFSVWLHDRVRGRRLPVLLRTLPGLSPRHRQWLIATVAILGFSVVSGLSIIASEAARWAVFLPLGLIGCIAVSWLVARAITGSPAAIMAYLAIVIITTDAEFRPKDAGDTSVDWQNLLKFAFWIGAGAIGFLRISPDKLKLNRRTQFSWYVYFFLIMLSCLYSLKIVYSFGCALSVFSMFYFARAIVHRLSEKQFLWTIALSAAASLVVGWIIYYLNPGAASFEFETYGGSETRLYGIAGQPDDLGAVCVQYLAAIFLLRARHNCRLSIAICLAALGIGTLAASDARTAMIAIAAATVVALLTRVRAGLIFAALTATVAAIAWAGRLIEIQDLGRHFSRTGDPAEVATLTGRIDIWGFVWTKFQEAPLFGWGYNASKFLLSEHEFDGGLFVDTAHNALLQNLLSVGIVGTLPVVFVLILLAYKMVMRPNHFRDMFFIIIFILGITETRMIGSTPTIQTLLFFIITLAPEADRHDVASINRSARGGLAGPAEI